MIDRKRTAIGGLVVSAALLVGIAVNEGYSPVAYEPVKGDRPTLGFGQANGVRMGDKTNPVRALIQLQGSVDKYAQALQYCIKVPLYQYEYDAYMDLAYNIGTGAFCGSTLVKKLNASDYAGACREILKWDKFHGATLDGLKQRRMKEYRQCIGEKNGLLAQ